MALLNATGDICIEAHENYIKSTYRNRCEILGSNGPIDLSIPLVGGRDHHQSYKDARIAYDFDWQHRHQMSIISCYGSAPFFEHYMPYLEPFFEKKTLSLFDLNRQILELLIRLMKVDVKVNYSDSFEKNPVDRVDLRNAFKPGKDIGSIVVGQNKCMVKNVPYMRVFEAVDVSAGLSCLDLLFNEGPASKTILKQMITEF